MRKLLLILLCVPGSVLAQQKGFVIKGYLKGIPDNTAIELKNEDISPQPLATTTTKGGKFILTGAVTDPNLYAISFSGNQQKLFIFLDNYEIQLNGHKDSLRNARVSGCPSHNDFMEFNHALNPVYSQLSIMTQQLNSGKIEFNEKVQAEYGQLKKEVEDKTSAFVKAKPASFVSPFVILVSTQINEDVFKIEEKYKQLSESAREGYFGKILFQVINEKKIGAVGTEAIDFVQNDTVGKPVALSSFRGKYVLVDFWASWCKPCRMENPNVVEAYKKFSKHNFTVLGVSLDRAREPWIKAIAEDKLSWTQVSDLKFWNNEAAAKYRIQSIPQNLLIDPDGKIVAKNLRGGDLHIKLEEILK